MFTSKNLSNISSRWSFFKNYLREVKVKKKFFLPPKTSSESLDFQKKFLRKIVEEQKKYRKYFFKKIFEDVLDSNRKMVADIPDGGAKRKLKLIRRDEIIDATVMDYFADFFLEVLLSKRKSLQIKKKLQERLRKRKKNLRFYRLLRKNPFPNSRRKRKKRKSFFF
jgi:hypothetical protein